MNKLAKKRFYTVIRYCHAITVNLVGVAWYIHYSSYFTPAGLNMVMRFFQ